MSNLDKHIQAINSKGFTTIECVYTESEIDAIIAHIDTVDQSNPAFRKTTDLFAIRRFIKEVPCVKPLIWNEKLRAIIINMFGDEYFMVKSIYFDKPESSNWFVAWHQDLTISVNKKAALQGFGPWTVKQNNFAVQPPLEVLEDNFTIRIHLDDTGPANGALKVIPGSHLKKVYRAGNIDWQRETEAVCELKAGGIMIMRPLLMHASDRSTIHKKRRVVHLEFSRAKLPAAINWAEKETAL